MLRRRWVLAGVVGAAWCTTAIASDWLEFSNETGARIVASSNLVASDTEEKDYAWGDIDNDGDIDLVIARKQPFTSSGKRRNVLLMNEGGVLVDRTNEYATAADDGGQGFLDLTNDRDVILVDLDLDGWLDMVTATTLSDGFPKTISHPRIYMNLGENEQGEWLGFEYQEARMPQLAGIVQSGQYAGWPHAPRFCSVSSGDVTGDGYPDLYFGDYDSGGSQTLDFNNRLLVNKGAADPGVFVDETTARLTFTMYNAAFGASSVTADINNDGVNDIVKQTSLNAPLHIAVTYNDPEDEGFFASYDVVNSQAPYFVTAGDLNNDDWLDLVVVDDGTDHFLLNNGNPSPSDGEVSFSTHNFPGTGGFGGNAWVADLDNDGWNDVFITDVDVDIPGCGDVFGMMRNNGNAPFVAFTKDNANIPNSMLNGIHDVAIFDIDGDGWLDMVIGRCDGTQLWMNVPPFAVNFELVSQVPAVLPPQSEQIVQADVVGVNAELDSDSVTLHVSIDGGEFVESSMANVGGDTFEGSLLTGDCGSEVAWFISATVDNGAGSFTHPDNGSLTSVVYSNILVELAEPFEAVDAEWTVQSADLTGGEWVQVVPNPTLSGASLAAPDGDATVDGTMAWVTENGPVGDFNAGPYDVDGGPTDLLSPIFDFEGDDAIISFDAWFFSTAAFSDSRLLVQVSGDRGDTWTLAHTIDATGSEWASQSFRLGEFITPTGSVQLRFRTGDFSANSIVEAGIDNLVIERLTCVDDTPVSIVSSVPADGSIDARQPFDINGDNADGWSSIELTFDGDVSGLVAGDFEITQNGGDQPAPTVAAVNVISGETVEVVFSGIIDDIAWTTIRHIDSDTSVSIASLPGDVNGDGTSAAGDVLTLIDAINGQLSLPDHSTDIDRSGASGGADVLREIDLLNGANAYDEYLGAQLPQ